MSTKKELLSDVQHKFGMSATNEFVKKCFDLSMRHNDFFFDVLTGCVELMYTDRDNFKEMSK